MSPAAFSRSIAIAIGINQYGNGVPPLKTAANDARALTQLLKSAHGYHVLLMVDEVATRRRLHHLLRNWLPQNVTPDDRVLFYFAGHGLAIDGEDGPAGYLVPQDAKSGDKSSFLSMRLLHDSLVALPCRHSLIILDCCFSGAFRWSSTRDIATHPEVIYKERFDRFIRDPAWQVITSAAYDQTAFDVLEDNRGTGQTGQHSPFAEALFDALRGDADRFPAPHNGQPGGDGVITASELYLYLRDRVEIATEERNQRQTPGLWSLRRHDKGEYIFLAPNHELNLPPAPELNPANNPYRGLESFEEAQAPLYFGRSQLTEDLQAFVVEHPLTVLLGPSGAGKSSLVKAGLIPALRKSADANWQILPPIRPGDAPLKALARAILALDSTGKTQFAAVEALAENLAQDPKELMRRVLAWGDRYPKNRLLLIVDQFEELMTQCPHEQERQQFLDLLQKALRLGKRRARIVLTLRSDFEPQFQSWLPDIWMQSRFLVKPMTQDELRQAIEAPAAERVMVFEPYNLADQLINEVVQMPGALPLLSFTLSELYLKYLQRQDGNRALTQADYEALGGVAGSLTQRATQEYAALKQQDLAYEHTLKRVMLRMVAVEGGELARRRVPRSELVYPSEAENARVEVVIQRLTAARLLVEGQEPGGEPYVEPAHDALVQGWNQLQRWKHKEQENLNLQRLLTPAAKEWAHHQRGKKAKGFLWNNNPRLSLLTANLKSAQSWLNRLEYDFVRHSLQHKRNNTLRLVGSLLTVILALSGLTTFAFFLQAEARKQTAEAERQSQLAQDNAAEAERQSQLAQDKATEAEKSTLEAKRQDIIALTEAAESAWAADQQLEALISAVKAGKRLKDLKIEHTAAEYQTVIALRKIVYGIRERNRLGTDHLLGIAGLKFSPDGNTIATIGGDGSAKLWSIDGQERKAFDAGHVRNAPGCRTMLPDSLGFTSDSQRLLTLGPDGKLKHWNLDGEMLRAFDIGYTVSNCSTNISSVSFSPDGQTVATLEHEGTTEKLKLRNLDGQELNILSEINNPINFIAFSFDGKFIAAPSEETIRIWNVDSKEITSLNVGENQIWKFHLSPNGQMIVTFSKDDRNIRLLSLDGQELKSFEFGDSWIRTLRFSSDGQKIATGDNSGKIALWNLEGQLLQMFKGHANSIDSINFSPDEKTMASFDSNYAVPEVRLWSTNGEKIEILEENADSTSEFNFILNDQSSRALFEALAYREDCKYANSSADGKVIAATCREDEFVDETARVDILNSEGEKILSLSRPHNALFIPGLTTASVMSVGLSADGQIIATAGRDGTVKLWNLEGQELRSFPGDNNWVTNITFGFNDQLLVAGSKDGKVRLWNLQGKLLDTLEGHRSKITHLGFSSDGKKLASTADNEAAILWNFDLDDLLVRGCNWLHDYLTNNLNVSDDDRRLCEDI